MVWSLNDVKAEHKFQTNLLAIYSSLLNMKKILFITSLIFSCFFVQAQEGKWKIKLNGKTLLYTSTENEKINIKKISSVDWKKNGYLEISFEEPKTEVWWYRSFQLEDEKTNQLFNKDSTNNIKIPLVELRKLFKGKKQLLIYSVVAPRNPQMAVRIRRVHLCTLKLP